MWTEGQRITMPHLVIIGVGLAYHVFEFLKRCGTIEDAYLIEADESIFQLAMKVHDFSSLTRNTSFHFLISSPYSDIERLLSTSLVQPFSYHIFSPAVSLHPDIYHPIIELVEKHLCALRLNESHGATTNQGIHLSLARGVEKLLNQMKTI
ncbi:MAG: hypothetical protein L7F78_02645 [Syntrophales bacterium LBB04]|nr:hypothetical protein [Syntrophales bacterium LBB04]